MVVLLLCVSLLTFRFIICKSIFEPCTSFSTQCCIFFLFTYEVSNLTYLLQDVLFLSMDMNYRFFFVFFNIITIGCKNSKQS
jgi:hypothetical protein